MKRERLNLVDSWTRAKIAITILAVIAGVAALHMLSAVDPPNPAVPPLEVFEQQNQTAWISEGQADAAQRCHLRDGNWTAAVKVFLERGIFHGPGDDYAKLTPYDQMVAKDHGHQIEADALDTYYANRCARLTGKVLDNLDNMAQIERH